MTDSHRVQNANQAFAKVESYLLPVSESRSPSSSAGKSDINSTPLVRLDQTLFQVALADHIRSMQTMYRDTHDEQNLVSELRSGHSEIKLPIKHLLGKIDEGRSRSLGLLKLCFGENSIEMLRGILDLAGSYALQGMWPQVNEKLVKAKHLIEVLGSDVSISSHEFKRREALDAAHRICCVFRVLREHCMRSNGQVKKLFVRELLSELSKVPVHNQLEDDHPYHPSVLCSSLHTFFVSNPAAAATTTPVPMDRNQMKASYFPDSHDSHMSPTSLAALAALSTQQQQQPVTTNSELIDNVKSWGEVVDYLRRSCPVLKKWQESMEKCLLPQNKASLLLPFKQCDLLHRSVAHPIQLSQVILRFPATAKLLAGNKLTKLLSQIPVQLPLNVDMNTGELIHIPPPGSLTGAQQAKLNFLNQSRNLQSLFYELPITMEEFFALYVIECDDAIPLELLKVQMLTLQGISNIYTASSHSEGGNHSPTSPIPSSAEDCLTKALNLLESCGLEMTVVACELYNSIAQLMIMKQRQWVATRKQRIKEELELWMESPEAKKEIKQQGKIIKKQFTDKNLIMAGAEVEMRAKNIVMKKRIRHLSTTQDEQADMNRALEAAYRYLVKSFEILEDTHGQSNPAVSTACLAVASVQNILGKYEDTREWLVRGLRYMEKHIPVPIRAITFTQTQLSQVLFKLGHDDEARRVLAKAAVFHVTQAQQGIAIHNNYHTYHLTILPPPIAAGAGSHGNNTERLDTARSNASSMHGEINNGKGNATGNVDDHTTSVNPNPLAAVANFIPPPILKGTPLHDEIDQAVDLTSRAIKLNAKSGDKWVAAQLSEDLALLLESSFGWDSVQAADAFKNVGIRCAAVSDWARSIKYLKQARDSHEVMYGKRDPRTLSVSKLLTSVRKSRSSGAPPTETAAEPLPVLDVETENALNITDEEISPLADAIFPIHTEVVKAVDENNSFEHKQYVFPTVVDDQEEDYGLTPRKVDSIQDVATANDGGVSPLSIHSGNSPLSGINLVRSMAKSAAAQLQI